MLTAIEIMALIVVLLSAIKLTVILINPKSWTSVVNNVYGNPRFIIPVSLILAVITLWYLLQELTIVQIFASMLFFMLLMLMTFATYSKEVIGFANKVLKSDDLLRRRWFIILIWVILIVLVLYTIFNV